MNREGENYSGGYHRQQGKLLFTAVMVLQLILSLPPVVNRLQANNPLQRCSVTELQTQLPVHYDVSPLSSAHSTGDTISEAPVGMCRAASPGNSFRLQMKLPLHHPLSCLASITSASNNIQVHVQGSTPRNTTLGCTTPTLAAAQGPFVATSPVGRRPATLAAQTTCSGSSRAAADLAPCSGSPPAAVYLGPLPEAHRRRAKHMSLLPTEALPSTRHRSSSTAWLSAWTRRLHQSLLAPPEPPRQARLLR